MVPEEFAEWDKGADRYEEFMKRTNETLVNPSCNCSFWRKSNEIFLETEKRQSKDDFRA